MGKTKTKTTKLVESPMPPAPWIYINSASDVELGAAVASLIPLAYICTHHLESPTTSQNITRLTQTDLKQTVCIINDNFDSEELAAKKANEYREATIKHGCNFVSVQVNYKEHVENKKHVDWGTNHLEIDHPVTDGGVRTDAAALKIFKALFKLLTVRETLHLIPEQDMFAVDAISFPGYEYCAIADSRKHPKDAKIQFVALITSKPEIGPDQRLHWTVADRTGTANFYFQYRGPSSKYTWDWVLSLKPGDRKALPRMPMVQVKEKKRVTVFKAPFRVAGFVIGGTGTALRGIGKGLVHVGHKVSLGKSSRWIPEADIEDTKVDAAKKTGKKEVKIFNESGEKTWVDDDSATAASIYDEKVGREFC